MAGRKAQRTLKGAFGPIGEGRAYADGPDFHKDDASLGDAIDPETLQAAVKRALEPRWPLHSPIVDREIVHAVLAALGAVVPAPTYEAAVAVVTAAERLRAAADCHHVMFGLDRWTVEHSLSCRASGQMANCDIHRAIAVMGSDGIDTDDFGRWRVTTVDDEGRPELERDDTPDGVADALAALDDAIAAHRALGEGAG